MKTVGKRTAEKQITYNPRADYLKEIGMWNDTFGEIRFFPKGVYRYKTHEEANEHYLNCLAKKIAKIEIANATEQSGVQRSSLQRGLSRAHRSSAEPKLWKKQKGQP